MLTAMSRRHERSLLISWCLRPLVIHEQDGILILLAGIHGAVLMLAPLAPVVALGVWWNSNTIAHNFIHNPFFRSRRLNALFSSYLTLLLGVPQTIWRERHLAHHAGRPWRFRGSPEAFIEIGLVASLWIAMLNLAPVFFLTVYLPGYAAGLVLCALHGYYEHELGTINHTGRLYNLLLFNDGYHAEHHANPGNHWSRLPRHRLERMPTSRWPAVLRWLDMATLESLERRVLCSRALQKFVLAKHERAFRRLLPKMPAVSDVAVVGGGLFPRTVLILQRLLPQARVVVIDASADNITRARGFLDKDVDFINARYDSRQHAGFDLLVIPLSFVGDRASLYRHPPASAVVIHDWIWRRHRTTSVISVFLLKRLNLVLR
jgi:Fatty acid desaturase